MIYLFYGEEEFLIDSEIKKLISKNKIDNNSISRYDLEVDSIKNVIDDACTISLFDGNKFIIVYNFDKLVKDDEKLLSEFINNVGEVIIVFVASKLDDRKKIVKEVKKISTSKEFNKNKNISNTVRSMFDDYKVDYKTVDLLVSMVGNDLRILSQEVEKLKTYKDNKEITYQDVLDLASSGDNDDIFDLINYIVIKDKSKAMSCYSSLLRRNEEPIKIIISLANQFRLLYQCKELYKKGNGEDSISKILDVHPYRVKLALDKCRNYSSKVLLDYLLELADIDSKIKNGLIDKSLALELFILGN